MRCLSGRCSVHTCGSDTLFPPDPSHTCYPKRDPVEEESFVFSGSISFRTDNTGTLKTVMTSVYQRDEPTFSVIRIL